MVTDINIRKINQDPNDPVVAELSIVLYGKLAIHGVKVIKRKGKYFVGMPSSKSEKGIFKDVVHPINQAFREALEQQIIQHLIIHGIIESDKMYKDVAYKNMQAVIAYFQRRELIPSRHIAESIARRQHIPRYMVEDAMQELIKQGYLKEIIWRVSPFNSILFLQPNWQRIMDDNWIEYP